MQGTNCKNKNIRKIKHCQAKNIRFVKTNLNVNGEPGADKGF